MHSDPVKHEVDKATGPHVRGQVSVYRHVQVLDDLPQQLLKQISHFFEHYKDMEESKWIKIEGWEDRETAHREILSSIEHFNKAPIKPCF